jgi:hypothetical protein
MKKEEDKYQSNIIHIEIDPWLQYTEWEEAGSKCELTKTVEFATTVIIIESELESVSRAGSGLFSRVFLRSRQ